MTNLSIIWDTDLTNGNLNVISDMQSSPGEPCLRDINILQSSSEARKNISFDVNFIINDRSSVKGDFLWDIDYGLQKDVNLSMY